ncbi:MAG: acyl carrier protein [Bryobacteraceae bacterium]
MTKSEIEAAVFAALRQIAPEVDPTAIDRELPLRDAAEIDSFDFLNLLIGIQERLGVEIPEADYRRISTLDSLIAYNSVFAANTAPFPPLAYPPAES